MRLSYKLNIGGTWVEVGSFKEDGSTNAGIVNSANTVIQNDYCTVDGKSVTNSASFQLTWRNKDLYTQIVDGILDAVEKQTNVDVVIKDVDAPEVLFTGKVDLSKVSISSGMIPESFSISCTDYIVALDEKINANIVYENAYVREIIENLLGRVYSEVALDAEVIYSITVGYFVVTTEDSFTYRDVIDTMLYERCQAFLYRNPATNGFEIKRISFDYLDTDISHQVHYLVGDKLITETKKWDKDGIVVTFPTVSELKETTLYTADLGTSWDEETGDIIGTTVAPNGFWPENGELTATYQEFNKNLLDKPYQEGVAKLQNSDIDLLFVREGSLRVSVLPSTGWDQPAVDLIGKPEGLQSYPRKAWFLMRNTSGADMNLLMVSMKGDAIYKEKKNKLIMPPLCKNPEEYETSYIFNTSEAQYFANYVTNFARLSQTTAAWVEFEKETNIGDIVIVKQKGASISQAYYVVSQQMSARIGTEMQYKYIAIAISGYEEHESYVDTSVSSKNPGVVISDADQYYYSTSKTELTGGEWLDDPVAGMEDKFLWKRRRIEYSMGLIKVTTPYFAGGEKGDKGDKGDPGYSSIVEWCLSASSTVFTEANKLRLYEYDSSFMLWDTYPLSNSSLWQRTKPQPTTELPYIWERVSEDSGATWSEPYCISINPFSSITLEASQLAYKILATGYVLEAQSIAVSCKKLFTNEPCYWIVKKGSETTKLSNVNTISIDIPVGASYRFVDVTCICDGKSRSLRIIGEAEALPTYQKLSTININDLATTTTRDDGSPLVVGDYRLVLSGDYHLPYVWDGTSWKATTPTDSNYGHVVSSLAPDVLASDQTIPSVSAIYGFFNSLFANSIVANSLVVGSTDFIQKLSANAIFKGNIGADTTLGELLASNTGLLSIGDSESLGAKLASNTGLTGAVAFKNSIGLDTTIAELLGKNATLIETLVAQNAFVVDLFSKNINITGALYGGAYNVDGTNPTNGTGFHLSKDGVLQAFKASLNDVFLSSYDDEGQIILETVKAQSGATISVSCPPTMWNQATLFSSVPANSAGLPCTWNGSTSAYLYRYAGTLAGVIDKSIESSSGGIVEKDYKYNVPFTGTLNISASAYSEQRQVSPSSDSTVTIKGVGTVNVYKNDSLVLSCGYYNGWQTENKSISVAQGDVIYYYLYTKSEYAYDRYIYQNVYTTGIASISADFVFASEQILITNGNPADDAVTVYASYGNSDKAIKESLVVRGSDGTSTIFNSANSLVYASYDTIVSQTTILPFSAIYECDPDSSSLTYQSKTWSIYQVRKTNTDITFYCYDSASVYRNFTFTFSSYGDSLDVTMLLITVGTSLKTASLIPATGSHTVGAVGNEYKGVYTDTLFLNGQEIYIENGTVKVR